MQFPINIRFNRKLNRRFCLVAMLIKEAGENIQTQSPPPRDHRLLLIHSPWPIQSTILGKPQPASSSGGYNKGVNAAAAVQGIHSIPFVRSGVQLCPRDDYLLALGLLRIRFVFCAFCRLQSSVQSLIIMMIPLMRRTRWCSRGRKDGRGARKGAGVGKWW